jgi:hypothetical protein
MGVLRLLKECATLRLSTLLQVRIAKEDALVPKKELAEGKQGAKDAVHVGPQPASGESFTVCFKRQAAKAGRSEDLQNLQNHVPILFAAQARPLALLCVGI